MGAEKASEIALKEISRKLAAAFMPVIEIRTRREEFMNCLKTEGILRVVDPHERF